MAANEAPCAKDDTGGFYQGIVTFNQNDYPHLKYPAPGYENATIKSAGCGVCAMSTVLNVPVEEMRDFAMACGARVPGGTDMSVLSKHAAKHWDVPVSAGDTLTMAGRMAIANTGGDRPGYNGVFSTGGHYVVAVGFAKPYLVLFDPGGYKGKYSAPHRAAVKVRGRFLLALPEVLDKDCENRQPRYYTF